MPNELIRLIESGRLRPGTHLYHHHRIYEDREAEALVVNKGIKLGSTVYITPSAAARSLTHKPVDGWTFWKLPDGSNLDSLRLDVRRRGQAASQ